MRSENENKVKSFHLSGDRQFLNACAKVPQPWGKTGEGVQPTRRQASKWLRGIGIAHKFITGKV